MACYTVYKTTNTVNGKFYIGMHKTEHPNDNYLGSGKILAKAIQKYGAQNFSKIVLHTYETLEEAALREKELVDPNDPLCYNIKQGGRGGFDYINSNGLNLTSAPRSDMTKEKMRKNHWAKGPKRDEVILKISCRDTSSKSHTREKQSVKMKQLHSDPSYKSRHSLVNSKPVIVDGVMFQSAREAAKQYNITPAGVGYRIRSSKFPSWYHAIGGDNSKQ